MGTSADSPKGEQLPFHLGHHTLQEPFTVHLTLGLLTTHTTPWLASIIAMVTIIPTCRTIFNIRPTGEPNRISLAWCPPHTA